MKFYQFIHSSHASYSSGPKPQIGLQDWTNGDLNWIFQSGGGDASGTHEFLLPNATWMFIYAYTPILHIYMVGGRWQTSRHDPIPLLAKRTVCSSLPAPHHFSLKWTIARNFFHLSPAEFLSWSCSLQAEAVQKWKAACQTICKQRVGVQTPACHLLVREHRIGGERWAGATPRRRKGMLLLPWSSSSLFPEGWKRIGVTSEMAAEVADRWPGGLSWWPPLQGWHSMWPFHGSASPAPSTSTAAIAAHWLSWAS